MKKEKQVRSYKRRTKSGKTVTVKAHTAKYEAADERAKEVSKKPGAGKELEERKKKPVQLEIPFGKEEEKKVLEEVKETAKKESSKKPAEKKTTKKVRPVGSGTNGPTPKKKSSRVITTKGVNSPTFTSAEFKEWYRGTGSAADKKVAKALRKQLGRSGYRKFEDEAMDNYTSRGHLKMFKRVSGGGDISVKAGSKESPKKQETIITLPRTKKDVHEASSKQMRTYKKTLSAEVKSGNSKNIREALKGYKQALDDYTFGNTKANNVNAEKDYQSVVKLLNKGGYDEQGYKIRKSSISFSKKLSVGAGTNGQKPNVSFKKGHFASKAEAVKAMKEKGYVVNNKGDVKTPFKNGISTSKGRIIKVGDTWTLRHPTR